MNIVGFQPRFSVKNAIPKVEIALPMYVQKLSIPEIRETQPVNLKYLGIMQISKKFTPFIVPVRRAESAIETIGLEFENIKSKIAQTLPAPKKTPAESKRFRKIFS